MEGINQSNGLRSADLTAELNKLDIQPLEQAANKVAARLFDLDADISPSWTKGF